MSAHTYNTGIDQANMCLRFFARVCTFCGRMLCPCSLRPFKGGAHSIVQLALIFFLLIQAALVALETPRSLRGLGALARHSRPLAPALLTFIKSVTGSKPQLSRVAPALSAAAASLGLSQHTGHAKEAEEMATEELDKDFCLSRGSSRSSKV